MYVFSCTGHYCICTVCLSVFIFIFYCTFTTFVLNKRIHIVAKNGNNVEATFDTVERIVQLVAFDNVASTLLLVWTGLK